MMKTKYGFSQFAQKTLGNSYRSAPPKPKQLKGWVVGAKFKRPIEDICGDEIHTVTRIDGNRVYGVDNLWTSMHYCTLVED